MRDLSRREVLAGGIALGAVALAGLPRITRAAGLPSSTLDAMGKSGLVYVSPLHPDGKESRCHGEVWFFEDGGDVVLATSKDAWKTRAVRKGWHRARVWVGDFGPAKGDNYKAGPTFDAKAGFDSDPAVFERMMASYAKKYADGWSKWEARFRKGYLDGSRVVIRYSARV